MRFTFVPLHNKGGVACNFKDPACKEQPSYMINVVLDQSAELCGIKVLLTVQLTNENHGLCSCIGHHTSKEEPLPSNVPRKEFAVLPALSEVPLLMASFCANPCSAGERVV